MFLRDRLAEIGYDVAGVGELDLALDKEDLNALVTGSDIEFVGSNINKRFPEDAWKEYIIKNIDGIKVGIFSELRSDLLRKEKAINPDYVNHARSMTRKLRSKGADIVICLAVVDTRRAEALADSVEDLDIVVAGHVAGSVNALKTKGKTYYLNSGDRGRYVGLAQVRLNRDKEIDSVAVSVRPLEVRDTQDAGMKTQVEAFVKVYEQKRVAAGGKAKSHIKPPPKGTNAKGPASSRAVAHKPTGNMTEEQKLRKIKEQKAREQKLLDLKKDK